MHIIQYRHTNTKCQAPERQGLCLHKQDDTEVPWAGFQEHLLQDLLASGPDGSPPREEYLPRGLRLFLQPHPFATNLQV